MMPKYHLCFLKQVGLIAISLLLAGCASTSVFSPYPEQMQSVRSNLNPSGYAASIKNLKQKVQSADKDLYGMELGRVQQLAGNYQASIKSYGAVINDVQQQQLAAKIRGSSILSQTGSLMTNDNSLPYQVKGYELIFLLNYQALNYLAVGDVQDAMVSIRQSDQQLQWFVSQHQYDIQQAQAISKQNGWSFDPFSYGPCKPAYDLANQVNDPMQNAFAYYLSGILYEATGDYNDAFISMQNALNVAPNNSYVRSKLLEILVERGSSQSQINQYLKQFGQSQAPSIPPNSGQVVVIYEQGLVPPMQSSSFPLNFQGISQIFVFPVYQAPSGIPPVLGVSLQKNNSSTLLGQTQEAVNVQALAAKTLVDEYPIIFIREALRLATQASVLTAPKNHSQNQSEQLINSLAASLYMSLMAGADLRSWLTLPNTVQVFQAYLQPAQISLILSQGELKQTVPVNIQANKTVLVWVVDAGNHLQVKLLNL
ncbi:MAG: hypothetical protein K0Q57_141 [Gammaproteobacteria bacterium]|nr:hypothetical protein [Gammaproteobacteria bacterium]